MIDRTLSKPATGDATHGTSRNSYPNRTIYSVFPGIEFAFVDVHGHQIINERKTENDPILEITYCREGRSEFNLNDEFVFLSPGDLMIVNANTVWYTTMSKIAVVYWSSTGNTEAMAAAVADGIKEAGAEVVVMTSAEFDVSQMDSFDAVAFGCPAMGAEVLEEDEFAPMFESCESKLSGKKIALFGSYGWGDGEWMRNWEDTCKSDGAILACDFVICTEAPDDDAIAACKALGKALV